MTRTTSKQRLALISRLRDLGAVDATETALFQQAAAARYGLGISEMKALDVLMREGPQTAGALAVQLHLTTGAITGVIDRLERRGIAIRRPDPSDRRRVVVEAKLEAIASGENVYLGISSAFDRLYATYSTEELEFLVGHLARAIELTREERARVVDAGRAASGDPGTARRPGR